MSDRSRLAWALGISVIIHFLALLIVQFGRVAEDLVPGSLPISVDLVDLPPAVPAPEPIPPPREPAVDESVALPQTRIVSPPDAGEEKAPHQTRNLSDRDNVVIEESVRVGQPFANDREAPEEIYEPIPLPQEKSAPELQQQADPRPQPAVAKGVPSQAALPRLDQLLPKFGEVVVRVDPSERARESDTSRRRSDSLSSAPVFTGRRGTMDFLPDIRSGDITLLNTKAYRFAPFVRRVAVRIFQHLGIELRKAVRTYSGGSGREFALVEAVMDRDGRFLYARIKERETNSSLVVYRRLMMATRPETFFDSNPPAGAESSDGNIHFLLRADLQVRASSPRGGRVAYYGVASVGLE